MFVAVSVVRHKHLIETEDLLAKIYRVVDLIFTCYSVVVYMYILCIVRSRLNGVVQFT